MTSITNEGVGAAGVDEAATKSTTAEGATTAATTAAATTPATTATDTATVTPAIEFRHVTKRYGDDVALDDVSLTIDQGEFACVIGTSGGGKTTLLKCVNGLVEPSEGDLLVEGRNIRDVDLIKLRRSIGYAIQGSVLFPHMTVEQNIAYVPSLWNGRDDARTSEAVRRWMGIVGLDEELLGRFPAELSGGQQQRVGIARALAASPRILLMDEPFGAVDEITRSQLQVELRRIFEQTRITVVFVTHDIDEALALATRVAVMDKGRLCQYATPEELVAHPEGNFVRRLVAGRHMPSA